MTLPARRSPGGGGFESSHCVRCRSRDCYFSLRLDALSAGFPPVAFRAW